MNSSINFAIYIYVSYPDDFNQPEEMATQRQNVKSNQNDKVEGPNDVKGHHHH